jgi:3-dehydroquinate dehydratase / shikimate dehydrogenase
MTQLCETVTAGTTAGLIEARDRSSADLVELRLDSARELDVAGVLAGRTRPVVVTCRPRWEGGQFDGSEEERQAILGRALDLGAEFVDVEWRARFDDVVRRDPARVVLSSHDFEGVPPDLVAQARAMRGTGAGTIKVAVMPGRLSDTLSLIDVAAGGPAVVVGMGDAGVATRLLAAHFGSRWTYAGQSVAPGQIPLRRMVEDFRFRAVHPDTAVFGVVSRTAMQSLSPAMHNAALAASGIDAVYVPLSAADFADFESFSARLGVRGASVTIPFKLDALAAASSAEAIAVSVGAANTLRRDARGGWEATNTDVDGFLAPLATRFASLRGVRAAVLGAGGAARAAIVALRGRGALVTVHARRMEQGDEVARDLGVRSAAWPPVPGSWDLLVNATPLGSASHHQESPLPGGPFDGRLAYDLTYAPGESRFLAEAREAGCATLDGLPMLVAQAERQFEWWQGRPAPPGVMRAAVEQRAADAGQAIQRPAGVVATDRAGE